MAATTTQNQAGKKAGGRSHRPVPILFGSPDWRQTGFLSSASDSRDHRFAGQVCNLPESHESTGRTGYKSVPQLAVDWNSSLS